MLNILSIFYAIVLLGVIVFVHELGHFLCARATGITVEEFAIGFGPKLWGTEKGGTQYTLRLLPLGGYCRFVDEEDEAGNPTDRPDAFSRAKLWKRFVTVLSGPMMNFALAYAAVVVFLMAIGFAFSAPYVYDLTPGMGAEAAGMRKGDTIVAVAGEDISFDEAGARRLREMVQQADPAQPLDFTVEREAQELTLSVLPTKTQDGYAIGIMMGAVNYRYPLGAALKQSLFTLKDIAVMMVDSLKGLVTTGAGLDESAGPIGMISIMSQELPKGADVLLNMIVLISLNLGIINLLPLPALDGGRLLIFLIEAIRRKPLSRAVEGRVTMIGALFLVGIMLLFTVGDISRLITGG
ncbi:MAG: M50 family metallopeptidase [Clostridia bacterium]